MGYRTIALNQNVNESVFNTDKKKRKRNEENKELPSMVPDPIDVSKLNEEFEGKLCILNRITFVCSDSIKTHTLVCSHGYKIIIIDICIPNILYFFKTRFTRPSLYDS